MTKGYFGQIEPRKLFLFYMWYIRRHLLFFSFTSIIEEVGWLSDNHPTSLLSRYILISLFSLQDFPVIENQYLILFSYCDKTTVVWVHWGNIYFQTTDQFNIVKTNRISLIFFWICSSICNGASICDSLKWIRF